MENHAFIFTHRRNRLRKSEEHAGLVPSLPVKNMDQLTANISIKRKLFSGWFYLAGLHNASEIMNYTGRSRCD
uniref:Uncharacterized protein n=1 Tax=Klebsiella pneumoniae TaxID=573 RepID=A0A6M6A0Q8_KLEPN|nr:hypothetical protein [Klebsiella pneumoniae]